MSPKASALSSSTAKDSNADFEEQIKNIGIMIMALVEMNIIQSSIKSNAAKMTQHADLLRNQQSALSKKLNS